MRTLLSLAAAISITVCWMGCELETKTDDPQLLSPANHLVINEVFTLQPLNLNVYSWIEFYNPTRDTIDIQGWSLNFSAPQTILFSLLFKDSTGAYVGQLTTFQVDSSGVRADVPLGSPSGSGPILYPNELFTIISDEERFRVFSERGPGPGPYRYSQFLQQVGDTSRGPGLAPDTVRAIGYVFYFFPSEELLLKDPSGTVVDVVRIGNYVNTGPNPYPNNTSLPMAPEYEAYARYAGGYSTGNSANDFYITGQNLRPLPHYYNVAYKK
jgi:hypothetical protein